MSRPPQTAAARLAHLGIARRGRARTTPKRRPRGFTLLECLVALAILAVALTSALRAVGSTAQSAATLRDHTLASWVAHNRLAELRATEAWPPLGRNEGQAEQANRRFVWREQIERTPNPLFRRVEIQVFDALSDTPLASASGFVVRPLR
ncbi:MAG: type II secretion system minor pseudopilin GspI [Rhodocyclaceae bacterium]